MTDLFSDWIYENNADNSARFVLGEKGDNPLVCIGVNPSTATPEKLDPTLRRVKKFSETLGFDGWMMFNLYPQRATDPDGLHSIVDSNLFYENFHQIQKALQYIENYKVWAAWGVLIEKRDYLINCLVGVVGSLFQAKWITLGDLTNAGHPRHPLYLRGDSEVRDFNVKEYVKNLEVNS